MDDDVLTPREELVMQLHYAEGWSLRRIARGIGVDSASVTRSHRSALVHLAAATGGAVFDTSEDDPAGLIQRQPVEWIPAREGWAE